MASRSTAKKQFKPHFIDQLITWIERIALPEWAFYLLFFLAVDLTFILLSWIFGINPIGRIVPGYFLLGTWFIEFLLINHLLVRAARSALQEFKPMISDSDESYVEILYDFTHIPRANANVWFFLGALVGVATTSYALENMTLTLPIPESFIRTTGAFGFATFAVAAYRSIHQLSTVRRLLSNIPRINLYDLNSIYALSLFPAKIVLLNLIYLWINPALLIFPDMFSDPNFLGYWGALSIFPAVIIYPALSGIRQRLISEKDSLLRENSEHLEEASRKLYRQMQSDHHEGLGDLERGVRALLAIRREIESVSTWPWKTETMRWLATATILPLALWIIQIIVQRFVAP